MERGSSQMAEMFRQKALDPAIFLLTKRDGELKELQCGAGQDPALLFCDTGGGIRLMVGDPQG